MEGIQEGQEDEGGGKRGIWIERTEKEVEGG